METKSVIIKNKTGLHARPASIFVKTAGGFKSDINLQKGNAKASAKSLINILALGLSEGAEITITASGEDEKEAVNTLADLINSKFGEE
ncbi:MAG: HPr family phosphocarrier protein [Solirubrobacterales bacterium]